MQPNHVLPDIELSIVEFAQIEHNRKHNTHKSGDSISAIAVQLQEANNVDDPASKKPKS